MKVLRACFHLLIKVRKLHLRETLDAKVREECWTYPNPFTYALRRGFEES